jgi:hypothetical protein
MSLGLLIRLSLTQQIRLPYVIAKAYFLSSSRDPENLTRAEVALQELIVSIDGTDSNVSCPCLLYWF